MVKQCYAPVIYIWRFHLYAFWAALLLQNMTDISSFVMFSLRNYGTVVIVIYGQYLQQMKIL